MTGFCKWCDTLTNSIVKVFESGCLIWVGCPNCYEKGKYIKRGLKYVAKV